MRSTLSAGMLAALVLVVLCDQSRAAPADAPTAGSPAQSKPQTTGPTGLGPPHATGATSPGPTSGPDLSQSSKPPGEPGGTQAAAPPAAAQALVPPDDYNMELLDYDRRLLEGLTFTSVDGRSEAELKRLINKHHSNDELDAYLNQLANTYPSVTKLHTIGRSVDGRELRVLEISENPGVHVRGKPEFRYIANMHGNEVVGRELLLALGRLILENYHLPDRPEQAGPGGRLEPSGASFIKKLVKATRIQLMPTMNPDGYARSHVACKFEPNSKRGRLNANNVDLNRNFPDKLLGTKLDAATQPEVEAVIKWSLSEPFVLSANLHGGALVVVIPYDGALNVTAGSGERRSPDHELFRELAESYSQLHPTMASGELCYDNCSDYHRETFPDQGTTTGAGWYSLYGGMMDWMYENTNDFHTTIELGCNQYPPEAALLDYWNFNKAPLLNYMRQVHKGIKGLVQNEQGDFLAGVRVRVAGIEHDVMSTKFGDYFRLLAPGRYKVRFELAQYEPVEISVQVIGGMAQRLDIKMRSLKGAQVGPGGQGSLAELLEGSTTGPGQHESSAAVANEDHSIVVATLVMSVITLMLLLSMVGAYLIQRQRYKRSQSVSVELQPRSSSTGVSLPKQSSSGAHHLSVSGSTINTTLST